MCREKEILFSVFHMAIAFFCLVTFFPPLVQNPIKAYSYIMSLKSSSIDKESLKYVLNTDIILDITVQFIVIIIEQQLLLTNYCNMIISVHQYPCIESCSVHSFKLRLMCKYLQQSLKQLRILLKIPNVKQKKTNFLCV